MKLSQRAKDRMAQQAADDSTSGAIPLLGVGALLFMVGAIVRLIF